jgi:hypothetical protein
MNITDEDANAAVRSVASTIVGDATNQAAGVALAPVHTYVQQLDKMPGGLSGSSVLVPKFACHWGTQIRKAKAQLSQLSQLSELSLPLWVVQITQSGNHSCDSCDSCDRVKIAELLLS